MPDPYTRVFQMPNGQLITSVVMDEPDFIELCDSLVGVFEIKRKERTDENMIERLKEAKHIPMMSRGTKTEFVFDQFDIETDLASFIVRGHGKQLALDLLG